MQVHLIQTPDALAARAQLWCQRPWLAIDTEFMRVDTYYARLCLVQVSDGEFSDCVDALAFSELQPLLDMLYAPGILKVFHAPGQDMEILLQLGGRCPQPLFDTQIAATLLGIGDQIGYAGLIENLLGVAIDKSLSRTDWARRPLPGPALDYAAADVTYLAQVYPMLMERLGAAQRLGWLAQDCTRLTDPAQYTTDAAQAWRRLKGLARLSPPAQHAAARLAAWREKEAQQRNRPRKWILEDDALYRLAERRPQTLEQMESLNVLPPKAFARNAEGLLQLMRAAGDAPEIALALDEQLDSAQKSLLQRLQDRLRSVAAQLGIPASYVAPRADLLELVLRGRDANCAVLKGWRREAAGEELLRLL